MPRAKTKKQIACLSVTLGEGEYAELTRLGEKFDLSAAWMTCRAISEFVARYRNGIEAEATRKGGGMRGK